MAIELNVTDRVTPMIQGVRQTLRDGSLENAMGRGAANLVQRHLFDYNASHPNQLGGKRTNFYAAAARSTNYRAKPGEVTVSVNHVGIAQRFYGGFIRPTGGRKFLTIPAIPEAHGKRASEFNNLRFGFTEGRFGGLVPALVEVSASQVKFGRKRKDGSRSVTKTGESGGRAVFFLARKVFQQANPGVLPSNQAIGDAAVQAGGSYIAQVVQKSGSLTARVVQANKPPPPKGGNGA